MDHCLNCGAGVTPDLRFCLSCGSSLAPACPNCGAHRVEGARFCGQCGVRLEVSDETVPTDLVPPTGTGAERRLVSILFADVVGFTAHAEDRDPEDIREFLSAYFARAAEVVERYGGTIEKFIGDAVMAVWGTPTAHEDDAERAVRAALDLVVAVREMEEGIELRAAVVTGEAAVTVGATDQAMVAGDLVNTASRLQGVAESGTVLVDRTTVSAAGRAIAFEAAPTRRMKGKSEPVQSWTAERVVAERGGAGRRAVVEPPFIGRDDELRTLKDALHATGREGRGRLVTVIGQPGLDKSRLAWELKKHSDGVMESVYWHEGSSPAYGEGLAFWALIEMVRTRCGIQEADDADTIRERLASTLDTFVTKASDRDLIEPHLRSLLGVSEEPPGDREVQFAAWRLFFERIATKGMVALVFDDLHRADESLFDFLDHLLDWAEPSPILVVALARPELLERRPTWGAAAGTSTTIHVRPLDVEDMTALVQGMLPGLPADTVAAIVDRAEGVPLYAVEIVRMLIDRGALAREGDRYRLVTDEVEVATPASLQALAAARLDALPPEERRLVQGAAVFGRTFSLAGLVAISGQPAKSLDQRLQRLARAELIESEANHAQSGTYTFVQGLMRDVAYSTLAKHDRADRHVAVATYLETLEDSEATGLVASHYLDAYRSLPAGPDRDVVGERAERALIAAAERSLDVHADASALTFIDEALSITTDDEVRARLWVMAATPAWNSSEPARGTEYIRQAIDWYRDHGRTSEVEDAIAQLVEWQGHASVASEIMPLIEDAVGRIDDADADVTAARLLNQLARMFMYFGRTDEAVEPVERGLAIAERLQAEPEIGDLFVTKAWVIGGDGRYRESMVLAEAGLHLTSKHGRLTNEMRARMNLSNAYITTDPAKGLEIVSAGVEKAARVGNATWASGLAGNEGQCALLLGDYERPLARERDLDRPYLSGFSRLALRGPALVARACTDRLKVSIDEELEAFQPIDLDETQARSYRDTTRTVALYGANQLDEAVESGLAVEASSSNASEVALAFVAAGHAAVWVERPDELAAILDRLRPHTGRGAVITTSARQLAAAHRMIQAGDGAAADEAEATYRRSLAEWRRLGLSPDVATAEMEMLRLFGDRLDDRDELAADARAILDAIGHVTLRERLEEVAPAEAMEVST